MSGRRLGLSLTRRALGSIRARSGLDDDLRMLGARLESIEASAQARIAELQAGLDAATAGIHELAARLESVDLRSRNAVQELSSKLEALDRDMQPGVDWAKIVFQTNWSAIAPLTAEPKVSVVLATRDRPSLLRRAIESVLAQTYPRWELIVVDDGGSNEARSVVDSVGDERLTVIDCDRSGAASARNLGLEAATGSLVAFLDDDNVMAPAWLRAVVVAFQDRPDVTAVYGAQLRTGETPVDDRASLLFVSPFDWDRLVEGNYIDLGVVAHRAGLEGIAFDEGLDYFEDWEYAVTLAGRFGIEPLPVVAGFYTTDAPDRLTQRFRAERGEERLRRRFRDSFDTVSRADDDEPGTSRPPSAK
jgi:Glycosyl transferase family 2